MIVGIISTTLGFTQYFYLYISFHVFMSLKFNSPYDIHSIDSGNEPRG